MTNAQPTGSSWLQLMLVTSALLFVRASHGWATISLQEDQWNSFGNQFELLTHLTTVLPTLIGCSENMCGVIHLVFAKTGIGSSNYASKLFDGSAFKLPRIDFPPKLKVRSATEKVCIYAVIAYNDKAWDCTGSIARLAPASPHPSAKPLTLSTTFSLLI